MKKKVKKKKKSLKVFRLNFYIRQWGMLERYKALTPSLLKYYMNDIKYLYARKPYIVKIYIEDPAGYTKEQVIPYLIGMPPNIKFIWGRRKEGWQKNIRVKLKGKRSR